MPPKVKITKNDIIEAALGLAVESGREAINTRSIAAALGCSMQPIFSNFTSMEELERTVTVAAHKRYLAFLDAEVTKGIYPEYKALGVAYIRFAKEEKELFKLPFMCDRGGKELVPTPDFERSVEIIMSTTGLSEERARLMHLEMWAYVHGIATMLATSFLDLDFELISKMTTDIYQGIRARHLGEEKNNECN